MGQRALTKGACLAPERGFSLLEVLVAFSIMAMSLSALYYASSGSVRGFLESERAIKAVVLAESVLALYPVVPQGGLRDEGQSGPEFKWVIHSSPFDVGIENAAWSLHRLTVEVSWSDRGQRRVYALVSYRPADMGGP